MAIWKVATSDGPRLACGPVGTGPRSLLSASLTLDDLLTDKDPRALARASATTDGPQVAPGATLLAPLGTQEVWAAGVTYPRSKAARREESTAPDHYDRVYASDRPEVFFKAPAWRVRGPGQPVGIREDSTWDVPEPELVVVVDATGRIVGYTIGNDMSSRSIEGENPLYLAQAKIYQDSAAIGPCIVPVEEAPAAESLVIQLTIERAARLVFEEKIGVGEMKRAPAELVDWLMRALAFPVGVVLMTGTGIVPQPWFALQGGDVIRITITGLGELHNVVRTVGPSGART